MISQDICKPKLAFEPAQVPKDKAEEAEPDADDQAEVQAEDAPVTSVVEVDDSTDGKQSETSEKKPQPKKNQRTLRARKKVIRKQPSKNLNPNRKKAVAPTDLRSQRPETKQQKGKITECGMYLSYVNEQG